MKARLSIALACALFPLLGIACEGDRRICEKKFGTLVSYRTEAIEHAFGDLFGLLPEKLAIKFVSSKDPEYAQFGPMGTYDQENHALIFPRRVLASKTPNPLKFAVSYWPYYQNERNRAEFPVIETIDNVLWSAYLQEAAKTRGLSWPHKDCESVDVGKRLPCEMLVRGIGEHIKRTRGRIFNTNRLDMILPEDFAAFRKRVWRTHQEYLDVQEYGGILLVQPLIAEFGVTRTLAYVAQTPFQVDEENMRTAVLRYQERARQELN